MPSRTADRRASLAIVVVNYASARLLEQNLTRVAAGFPEALVVVVDNFSGDAEADAVRALCARHGWRAVLRPRNGGFGAGVNAGVEAARDAGRSLFLLLNPDALIDRADIDLLLEALDPAALGAAAPRILTGDGRPWFAGVDLLLSDGSMRAWANRPETPDAAAEPWLTGACLLLTEATWSTVGPFDDEYFLYWEDVDYSYRVTRAGGPLLLIEHATARHDEGGTQEPAEGRAKSELYYYYNIRNRLLFATRHLDPDGMRRWRRSSLRSAREVLLRGGRRQFLHPIPPLRAAVRALRDGRRLIRRRLSGSDRSVIG